MAHNASSCLQVRGDVTYNGHGMTEFVPEKTSAYVDQVDNHIPGKHDPLCFLYQSQPGRQTTCPYWHTFFMHLIFLLAGKSA